MASLARVAAVPARVSRGFVSSSQGFRRTHGWGLDGHEKRDSCEGGRLMAAALHLNCSGLWSHK